jgi:hypothetical protein
MDGNKSDTRNKIGNEKKGSTLYENLGVKQQQYQPSFWNQQRQKMTFRLGQIFLSKNLTYMQNKYAQAIFFGGRTRINFRQANWG